MQPDSRLPHRAIVRVGKLPLPYFAEYPYFLWGEVAYDSDGDCSHPTDCRWQWLYLENRATGEQLEVARESDNSGLWVVAAGERETVELAAYLTALRSRGTILDPASGDDKQPNEYAAQRHNIDSRLDEAERVRRMFMNPQLAPFDSMRWWGGWKWVGRFASDFTRGRRLAMLAVQEGTADPEVVAWLRQWWAGWPDASEREGVRAALLAATGIDPTASAS